jgi:hypothetical protein
MPPQSPIRGCLIGMALVCACALAGSPAGAETLDELDALSDISIDESAGIAAAQQLAGRGAYLEALATLERVLAVHPKSREARLTHALYLCQVDDRRGGLVELGKLKKKQFGEQRLAEARAMCERGQGG